MIATLKHPIYKLVCSEIIDKNLITEWFAETDKQLAKPNRNKHLITTETMTRILQNMTDSTKIVDVLQDQYVMIMINTFRNTKRNDKDDDFLSKTAAMFDAFEGALRKEGVDGAVKLDAVKKLMFGSGTMSFEKITRSKLVQHVTALLDEDGVVKLAQTYKDIAAKGIDRINFERSYAAQLFVKLISHPAVAKNIPWRVEQTKFLLRSGLFRSPEIGNDLATVLKECFFRSLDMKLLKLVDVQGILTQLIEHVNGAISSEELRVPLSEPALELWSRMLGILEALEQKRFASTGVAPVFRTLLLYMGLWLLSDYETASGCLRELFSCFERLSVARQAGEEPEWIEVVVDLFLSLLSQNSHLLRTIIG